MIDADPADAGYGTACADIIGRLAPRLRALWNRAPSA
jgi:hypothetical protein